ncbi:MAG TPA: putative metal-dependent hydrolase [Candidatus Saccharimonadales bacterium]|nr:putative metal-dependent hydrolase [Candidatus Saccharimonadales bacterium]
MNPTDLAYPIGRFEAPARIGPAEREGYVAQIAAVPADLRRAVEHRSDRQLDTPYRPGGWSVRQVVHHLPDSHLNAYLRLKLALTEAEPTVRPYDEARWAALPEAHKGPIAMSLDLLDSLHQRWVACLRSLPPEAFARTLRHPEDGLMSVDQLLAKYAWHGRHHLAHITSLAAREGWQKHP